MSGGSCAVRNCRGSRSCASSGMRSASVSTACTPGQRRAALVSMPRIAAWACGLRTNAASSVSGKRKSATKRPAPVSRGRSSSRLTEWPMYFTSCTHLPGNEATLGTAGVVIAAADADYNYDVVPIEPDCLRLEHDLLRKPVPTFRDHALGLQPLLETALHPGVVVGPPFIVCDVRDLLVVGVRRHQFRQAGVEEIERLGMLRGVIEEAREHRLVFGPSDDVECPHAPLRVGRADGNDPSLGVAGINRFVPDHLVGRLVIEDGLGRATVGHVDEIDLLLLHQLLC